ncbi:MAG TPA: hypothetical protein PLQ50_00995 [Candidatus Woesebacteria bacterium]|nr:hypothetical protein [Candidatus Woesebacteria bacterium]
MKLTLRTKLLTIFIPVLMMLLALSRGAQTVFAANGGGITNPVIGNLGQNEGISDGSKLTEYLVYIWQVAINLGAIVVIVFFIWGAFEWLTAGSDSKKTESAQKRITNAVIGLVILVSLFTILSFLNRILFRGEFDLLRLTFPTL